MKICILSDVHSNEYYLMHCINEAKLCGAEKIICLGDTVGYFDKPQAVFDMLQAENAECLMGNHEAMLLGLLKYDESKENIYRLKSNFKGLNTAAINAFKDRLPYKQINIDGLKLLFAHGSPFDPLNGYAYSNSEASSFSSNDFDFVFVGHTHIPFYKKNKNTTFINVGSCGLPRDVGNKPSFALLDTKTAEFSISRIELKTHFINNCDVHISVFNCIHRGGTI